VSETRTSKLTVRERVEYLLSGGGQWHTGDIRIQLLDVANLDSVLSRMVTEARLVRLSRGVYQIASAAIDTAPVIAVEPPTPDDVPCSMRELQDALGRLVDASVLTPECARDKLWLWALSQV